MSGKPWEKYVTQAFIDECVLTVRTRSPMTRPPYSCCVDSGGEWRVSDGRDAIVFRCSNADIAEAIAAALNEAARPAPEPTLLEAAKAYLAWVWPHPALQSLRSIENPACDPGDHARALLLAIDRAEAAAKCPPAPTLPEDVDAFLNKLATWGWASASQVDTVASFQSQAACLRRKYAGGAA